MTEGKEEKEKNKGVVKILERLCGHDDLKRNRTVHRLCCRIVRNKNLDGLSDRKCDVLPPPPPSFLDFFFIYYLILSFSVQQCECVCVHVDGQG